MIKYWRLLAAIACCFSSTAPAFAQQTHVVSAGDTLYGIVAQHYPKRMVRWTDVAVDLVELNPEAFPDGLDTVLKLGDVLVLVDYKQSNQVSTTPIPNQRASVSAPKPSARTLSQPSQSNTSYSAPGANLDRARDTVATSTVDLSERPELAPTAIENVSAQVEQAQSDHTQIEAVTTPSGVQGLIVGTITVSTQPAWAIDHSNQKRLLAVNERVYLGDAITTSNSADLSIRMLDTAEIHLLPNSRLMFETYHYDEQSKQGGTVMTLVKGGFRMSSGLIGQHNPGAVAVNTAVAAVGITGTEFGLRICTLDACETATNGRTFEPGLYTGVLDGAIVLSNNTGDHIAKRGEFYYVAAPSTKPRPAPESANLIFNSMQLASLGAPAQVNQPLGFWGWLKSKIFGN